MAQVLPLSAKAKNRLHNVMKGDPNVTVEQIVNGKAFLVSSNRKWCAWVSLSGDPNWDVTL